MSKPKVFDSEEFRPLTFWKRIKYLFEVLVILIFISIPTLLVSFIVFGCLYIVGDVILWNGEGNPYAESRMPTPLVQQADGTLVRSSKIVTIEEQVIQMGLKP